MTRVLFVCLGNICRSPTAEGVFRAMAEGAGLKARADSAGTGDWHVGSPPYPPAIRAAARRGYDIAPLRARQFSRSDFGAFDLILAMDAANLQGIERLRPAGALTPAARFLDHVGLRGDVPDPYYTGGFDDTLDLVEEAARRLVAQLAQ